MEPNQLVTPRGQFTKLFRTTDTSLTPLLIVPGIPAVTFPQMPQIPDHHQKCLNMEVIAPGHIPCRFTSIVSMSMWLL